MFHVLLLHPVDFAISVIILSSEPRVQFTSMYAVDNDVSRNLVYFSLFYELDFCDKIRDIQYFSV